MRKKVIVIDDNVEIRVFVETVLEENGYEPLSAVDGEDGIRRIRQETPDMVILDLLMPKQSGVRLYKTLKADDALKNIPVLVLSGLSRRSFLKNLETLTADDSKPIPEPEVYLEKSIDADELAEAVKKIIG